MILSSALAFQSCNSTKVSRYYERGAVASTSPIASDVGAHIFERGGNAFDVAVAVGFALAVTNPQAGNIGGGGFAVIRDGKTGDITTLDFREVAPGLATEQMYLDDSGRVMPLTSTVGASSSGVPGTVAGLHNLWKQYGTLPWRELLSPAITLADSGFVVDSFLTNELKEKQEILMLFEETADIYFAGGHALTDGTKLVQKDLSSTLALIAADGPEAFYQGKIAAKIDSTMRKYGGLISLQDLHDYSPVWREPIHFSFDSLDVYSMAPPSSGGVIIGQILKLLEPFDFSLYQPDSPEYMHLFAEASRLAFADRSVHLGDPAFHNWPRSMLDRGYISDRRSKIDSERATTSENTLPGNVVKYESDATTHFSVSDSHGNMVAITTTLNSLFGSGLVVSGAGFLLNNEMDDFSIKPGHPNLYGLIGAEANKIEPGKRMLSSMSPTIITRDGKPVLVLGSTGGSKIITSVSQAIISFSRFGLSPAEIVSQPRIHHQWLPDILYFEKNWFGVETIQPLLNMGHHVEERSHYGDLQLIHIGPSGLMTAACDPRNGGQPAGY